jgi:hypothetical protein
MNAWKIIASVRWQCSPRLRQTDEERHACFSPRAAPKWSRAPCLLLTSPLPSKSTMPASVLSSPRLRQSPKSQVTRNRTRLLWPIPIYIEVSLKGVEQAGTFSFPLLLECLFGGKTPGNRRLRCKDTWIAHMAVETKRQALNLGLYQFIDITKASHAWQAPTSLHINCIAWSGLLGYQFISHHNCFRNFCHTLPFFLFYHICSYE